MYGVMRDPETTSLKSHVRLSPETFETLEKAQAYIDECQRRRFLLNVKLVIVELVEVKEN